MTGIASRPRRPTRPQHRARRHAASLGLQRRAVGVRLRRRRRAVRGAPPGPDLPLDHRLRAAQGRARRAGGERFLRHDGPLPRAPRRRRRGDRPDRRSWHEREDGEDGCPTSSTCRTCSTAGSAPAGRASSCRSPTLTSSTMARSARSPPSICPRTPTSRPSRRASPGCAGSSRARGRTRRRFELPADRIGDLVLVSRRDGDRHRPRATTSRASTRRCAPTAASPSRACR